MSVAPGARQRNLASRLKVLCRCGQQHLILGTTQELLPHYRPCLAGRTVRNFGRLAKYHAWWNNVLCNLIGAGHPAGLIRGSPRSIPTHFLLAAASLNSGSNDVAHVIRSPPRRRRIVQRHIDAAASSKSAMNCRRRMAPPGNNDAPRHENEHISALEPNCAAKINYDGRGGSILVPPSVAWRTAPGGHSSNLPPLVSVKIYQVSRRKI